jgi:GNAT superfamily N-acetyltransferase
MQDHANVLLKHNIQVRNGKVSRSDLGRAVLILVNAVPLIIPDTKQAADEISISREDHPEIRKCDYYIVAKHRGKQIGFASFGIVGDHLMEYKVAVDPEYRRKGIASKMYDYAEKVSGVLINPKKHGIRSKESELFWKNRNKG